MRRYLYLAGVAGAALCVTFAASAAFADTGGVLTVGGVGGTNVAVGDTVTASLASGTNATFYSTTTGTSGVTCTASSFSSTVTANPPAPGVATETIDAQSFTDCSTNVFGTTGVRSVTLNNLPYQVSVDGATNAVTVSPGSAGPIQSTVVINTLLGTITCVYQPVAGSLAGTADNATNSIQFVNQQFNKLSGSSLCLATAYWTATYAPVTDTTQAGAAVFVNATAPEPTDTATPTPTDTTATPEPTDTATPEPTDTTATPEPTDTTATPEPTDTATPEPTDTATPEPTDTATA